MVCLATSVVGAAAAVAVDGSVADVVCSKDAARGGSMADSEY